MPAALLALALLAATIDPRLAEPLRILAQARDANGEPVGAVYATIPRNQLVTLTVGKLPENAGGNYNVRTRTVTIAEAVLAEDPRIVAAGLAHELRHASDLDAVALGLLPADCIEIEARGFDAQATIGRALYPAELPSGTASGCQLAMLVT